MRKEFRTFRDQLDILKVRGLLVTDEDLAIKKLASDNYYNIINGYKDLFIDSTKDTETYKRNATFEEIYALYSFDRSIRSIIFKAILQVENTLRTQISYVFSKYHDSPNYLIYGNFETLLGISTEKKISERAMDIYSLISNLQKDISKSVKHKDYIRHHVIEYGYVPMWVLVNAVPLNRLSSFYKLMNQRERIEVSKYWNILENHLRQYINKLAYFRNLCAHDERIYCSRDNALIPDTVFHEMLNIKKNSSNNYIQGKNDLLSLLISLKVLMPKDDFITFFNQLNGRIISLSTKLNSIDIIDVLNEMGIPKNWEIIKTS